MKEIPKRLMEKSAELMAEMADEILGDDVKKKMDEKFRSTFKDNEIPYTLTHLKAMYEGMMIMLNAQQFDKNDSGIQISMLLGAQAIIQEKKKAVKNAVDKSVDENLNGK